MPLNIVKFREILNIVLINLIVFFALISIHEIGHSAAGMLLGCRYEKSVLMDYNFAGPYTEMYCSNVNGLLISISSLLITSFFSALFLFLRAPTRNLFLIGLGLSVIFSSIDISVAASLQSMMYPMVSLGFFVTAVGEYFIASYYAKNNFALDLLDIEAEFS